MLLLSIFLVTQQLLIDPEAASSDLLPFETWPVFSRLKQLDLPPIQSMNSRLAAWLDNLGPGYTQSCGESGRLVIAPGHAQSALWMATIVGLYIYSYHGILSSRNIPTETGPMSALFFLLLVLLFLHGLTSGLAFLLDYSRAPVLLVFVLLLMLSSSIFKTEHVYELNPPYTDNPDSVQSPPRPDLELPVVFDGWHCAPPDSRRGERSWRRHSGRGLDDARARRLG